jgi:hypothetical protein
MTVIRFAVVAALCTSGFAYAQAPPSQVPTQEVPAPPVSTPVARDTQGTPDTNSTKEGMQPTPEPTRVLGAEGRAMPAPTSLRRPVEPADLGLGRYSDGYLP